MRIWSRFQTDIFHDIVNGKGHTVVQARAGSGKSSTIEEGLRHVPRGCTVGVFSFGREIARSMEARLKKAGIKADSKTTHSHGFSACRYKFGPKLAVDNKKMDAFARALVGGGSEEASDHRRCLAKAASLAKGALAATARQVDDLVDEFGLDLGEDVDRAEFAKDVLKMLDWSKNPYLRAQMRDAKSFDQLWVVSRGEVPSIDYDDMCWLPVVLNLRVWAYDRLFIDETQDLNACQIKLALRSIKPNGRICAVGDELQAIYWFRGADKDAMRNVISALGAKVLPLSITYRCARKIVEVANKYVPDLEAAPDAEEGVVGEATPEQMVKDAKPGDFILSRTNAPLTDLCLKFIKAGKRASIQGRDIGTTLAAFVKKSKCKTIDSLRDHIDRWAEREITRILKKDPEGSIALVEDKAATLHVLAEQCATIDELLGDLDKLFSDNKNADESPDLTKITLSTTHKAKGLERERCYLLADTFLRVRKGEQEPNQEEKNLYYVAVTRAKRELYFVRGVR